MKTLFTAAIAAIAAGVLLQAPAVAQTPAGQTSTKEGVCSSLPGQKPGPSKNAPNRIITANYNKQMRDGDPATPCAKAKTPCPCWDESGFGSSLPKPARIQSIQAYGRKPPLRVVST